MHDVLTISGACKTFAGKGGARVHAVDEVDLRLSPGETIGVIGESGSGKSTLGRLALGLLDVDAGDVTLDGVELGELNARELRRMRSVATMVFQEPLDSLNPRQRVCSIIEEPLRIHHRELSREQRWERVLEAMTLARLEHGLWDRFPRDLSGGQQQRVGIARAIVVRPKLIVLDEPTASLDMSVAGEILGTLRRLQQETGVAYVYISHDIHTVRFVADRVAVMYRGRVVEHGEVEAVFATPTHPYTIALLSAGLSVRPGRALPRVRLVGEIPPRDVLPAGCVLAGRCPIGEGVCFEAPVPLHEHATNHQVACIRTDDAKMLRPQSAADCAPELR